MRFLVLQSNVPNVRGAVTVWASLADAFRVKIAAEMERLLIGGGGPSFLCFLQSSILMATARNKPMRSS